MERKYIAGTKSDFDATFMRLLKGLYPLLNKALGDLSTTQSIWVKNIIYIYQAYTPTHCQLLVGLKSQKSHEPLYSTIWTFQKSRLTRMKVAFQ
jgi:hypothetical protein